jgi:DNA-binding HxlR family transcriptional regulator
MSESERRSRCPVACTLDIIGDKWSMVVIRDLFLGVRRFNDFLKSPERITTNILASRLQRLEEEGLIDRKEYQDNPVRYEYGLTEKGRELAPVMRAMVEWARAWQSEVIRGPFPESAIAELTRKLGEKRV